tara:strand:+ start:581 stop:769 length:189 start_codon:yes stop_codon:yes gene_type:complete
MHPLGLRVGFPKIRDMKMTRGKAPVKTKDDEREHTTSNLEKAKPKKNKEILNRLREQNGLVL